MPLGDPQDPLGEQTTQPQWPEGRQHPRIATAIIPHRLQRTCCVI